MIHEITISMFIDPYRCNERDMGEPQQDYSSASQLFRWKDESERSEKKWDQVLQHQ